MEKSEQKISKRPLSAFMFFMQDFRLTNKDGNNSISGIAKSAGAKWKIISESEKQKYVDMAEKDKKRHKDELASGMVVASRKSKKKSFKDTTKRVKDPNAPKKARTAYICFLTEFRKSSTLTGAKLVSKGAEQWKLLDDKTRQKFVDMENNDKKRYAEELKGYEESGMAAKYADTLKNAKNSNKSKRSTRNKLSTKPTTNKAGKRKKSVPNEEVESVSTDIDEEDNDISSNTESSTDSNSENTDME